MFLIYVHLRYIINAHVNVFVNVKEEIMEAIYSRFLGKNEEKLTLCQLNSSQFKDVEIQPPETECRSRNGEKYSSKK